MVINDALDSDKLIEDDWSEGPSYRSPYATFYEAEFIAIEIETMEG